MWETALVLGNLNLDRRTESIQKAVAYCFSLGDIYESLVDYGFEWADNGYDLIFHVNRVEWVMRIGKKCAGFHDPARGSDCQVGMPTSFAYQSRMYENRAKPTTLRKESTMSMMIFFIVGTV